MPKLGKTQNMKPKIPQNIELTCAACTALKKDKEYYISYNPIHSSGRIPYCKLCLKKMISDDSGNVTLEKLQSTLQLIDRPFIFDLWKVSLEDENDSFGTYMKNLGLKQNRQLTWKDSVFRPQLNNELHYNNCLDNNIKKNIFPNFSDSSNDFILTNEIFELFGAGYTQEEYQAMWRKYNFLKNNYKTKTNMHIEALVSYVRFKVKEEFAISLGNVEDAAKWAKLSKDAATAAKINPQQLSAADLSEGLSTVSQISKAVEQVNDIISILPKFKQEPQDIVDFTIWSYVNYERDLNGKPLCSYEEIYKFYDKMVLDNMSRYSFLKKDITVQGRNNAKSFIDSNEEENDNESLEEGEVLAEELSD